MGKRTNGATGNGAVLAGTVTALPLTALVQVQTLHGTQGTGAAFATVQAAVVAYNKLHGLTGTKAHVAEHITVLPANVKGMQWILALWATVARQHGAAMVRLGVHGGEVAICGVAGTIKATKAAVAAGVATYGTMVASAYDAGKHGNQVSYKNGWLCGAPAGLQAAHNLTPALAYGVGYLFTFPAPTGLAAYVAGYNASLAHARATVGKPASQPATRRNGNASQPATRRNGNASQPTGEVASQPTGEVASQPTGEVASQPTGEVAKVA